MKKIILFTLLLMRLFLFSQKEDYQWIMGYEATSNVGRFGTTIFDFNKDSLNLFQDFSRMDFRETNANISDENGELLFYTNGIYIANGQHERLINGHDLNPSEFTEEDADRGLRIIQGALALPSPADSSLYYLIHTTGELVLNEDSLIIFSPLLYYTTINMAANDGRGRGLKRNQIFKKDTLSTGNITAVKHANGRDWWILCTKRKENKYYKFLLDLNGIREVESQRIGGYRHSGLAQSVFSPDGTKYVRYSLNNNTEWGYLYIYDFDRCTGGLSNFQELNIRDTTYSGGVAISPNSRYLYVSSYEHVYQFDLEADDIFSTQDTIAIYDGFYTVHPFFRTTFFLAQLAPDGKIYINSNNGVDYMHVIHEPDSAGLACNLEQHGVKLPTANSFSMPNFPNYRLGKLENSPCDTIRPVSTTSITLANTTKITTYPNPVQHQLTVDLSLSDYTNLNQFQLELTNLYGQRIEQRTLRAYSPIYRFEVGDLPRGVYFINLYQQGEFVISKKVVLQ